MEATRVAVVFCPEWPAVAARLDSSDESPTAVVHANRVVARTPDADGVEVGMRRREAQATCPALRIVARNPDRDRLAFEPVVAAVGEHVALLEVSSPGQIVLAARSASRHLGGDAALADRLFDVARATLAGRAAVGVGVADGRLMGLLAARHSAVLDTAVVVSPGDSRARLAALPVAVLADEVGPEMVSLLQRLGLATLGSVAEIGASMLTSRFGSVGVELHRLASGADRHPPVAIAPPPTRATTVRFDHPVEDVHLVVASSRDTVERLVEHLGGEGVTCVRLALTLHTDHGEQNDRVWYEPEGLSSAALLERLRWQLESWVAARGPTSGVVMVRLAPLDLRARSGRQLGLWGANVAADDAASRAVRRLAALLGGDAVRVPEWCGGRHPEEAFVLAPALSTDLDARHPFQPRSWRGALPAPSPSVVYDEPCPVQVLDETGSSIGVSGRHELSAPPVALRVGGARFAVRAWSGPWPVEERWWDTRRRRRLARMQVVVVDESGRPGSRAEEAFVLALERGRWWITAKYG